MIKNKIITGLIINFLSICLLAQNQKDVAGTTIFQKYEDNLVQNTFPTSLSPIVLDVRFLKTEIIDGYELNYHYYDSLTKSYKKLIFLFSKKVRFDKYKNIHNLFENEFASFVYSDVWITYMAGWHLKQDTFYYKSRLDKYDELNIDNKKMLFKKTFPISDQEFVTINKVKVIVDCIIGNEKTFSFFNPLYRGRAEAIKYLQYQYRKVLKRKKAKIKTLFGVKKIPMPTLNTVYPCFD